jgi:hypothetical protein
VSLCVFRAPLQHGLATFVQRPRFAVAGAPIQRCLVGVIDGKGGCRRAWVGWLRRSVWVGRLACVGGGDTAGVHHLAVESARFLCVAVQRGGQRASVMSRRGGSSCRQAASGIIRKHKGRRASDLARYRPRTLAKPDPASPLTAQLHQPWPLRCQRAQAPEPAIAIAPASPGNRAAPCAPRHGGGGCG